MQAKIRVMMTLLILGGALAAQATDCLSPEGGFVPESRIQIPVNSPNQNRLIDEKKFNEIISKVESVYGPVVEALGAKLLFERKWSDGKANAYAKRPKKNDWVVALFGGLARHPDMTPDAFLLVACHELGHHLGGSPLKPKTSWIVTEGQADYFASLKCFRQILESEDNVSIVQGLIEARGVPEEISTRCEASFQTTGDIALCLRSGIASVAISRVLGKLGSASKLPSPSTPDLSVVKSTFAEHPKAQCRLDTFLAGTVCPVSWQEEVVLESPLPGTCASEKGDPMGFRPRCWYKPIK